MKKFFESIKIDLHPYDVLVGGTLVRAWDYYFQLQREVFRKYYNGKTVSALVYQRRPFLNFIPRANGSR